MSKDLLTLPTPKVLARRARLRYTSDESEGICRVRRGKSTSYLNGSGKAVPQRQLRRIEALGIPPAWTDVWICGDARGHLQATGRDARGRKQYIYHGDWHIHTSRTKFEKLAAFGLALKDLRRQVRIHLRQRGLPRQKVTATVVALLDGTLIRVGNEEYARANGSYGLTTLRDQHAQIDQQVIRLRFKAKSGKLRQLDFFDPQLARIVRQCQDLPGQRLFQYCDDDGQLHRLESADVNSYLKQLTGQPFTAKDFRTWKATVLVLQRLSNAAAEPVSKTESQRLIRTAFREAADALGNTVTICRKYYVHPHVVKLFQQGRLHAACGRAPARPRSGLELHEHMLLRVLSRSQ